MCSMLSRKSCIWRTLCCYIHHDTKLDQLELLITAYSQHTAANFPVNFVFVSVYLCLHIKSRSNISMALMYCLYTVSL